MIWWGRSWERGQAADQISDGVGCRPATVLTHQPNSRRWLHSHGEEPRVASPASQVDKTNRQTASSTPCTENPPFSCFSFTKLEFTIALGTAAQNVRAYGTSTFSSPTGGTLAHTRPSPIRVVGHRFKLFPKKTKTKKSTRLLTAGTGEKTEQAATAAHHLSATLHGRQNSDTPTVRQILDFHERWKRRDFARRESHCCLRG